MRSQPNLRFSSFHGDWGSVKLGESVELISGYAFKSEYFGDEGRKLITPQNFTKTGTASFNKKNTKYSVESCNDKYICSEGDLVILLTDLTSTCELLGKPIVLDKSNGEVLLNQRIVRVETKAPIRKSYLAQFLQTEKYHRIIKNSATGTTVRHSSNKILKSILVDIPTEKEQQKIADFLSTVDKKISLLKEKHALLEQYKKGVMQKLFSQEIRFKDEADNDFPDWEEDRLDSFVVKASDPVKVDPDATYREIGVRSHAKGVFHKKPIKGHELGNKRVFWVHPKAFIVNIVFAWEHAVALTSDSETGFIASHRFPMFVPKEDRVDLRYFTIFFKSKRGKHLLGIASPGGAGRNKTLGQSNFAELKLTMPCLGEQTRIADFYESLDKKEKLVSLQIEHIQTFKKGLLQQMFV